MPERSRTTSEKVEKSIKAIQAYLKEGRRVTRLMTRGRAASRQASRQEDNGTSIIATEAKKLSWNETRLRKAYQLTRPGSGYSDEQLAELFRLLRLHQPVFGTAHLGILVTLSWDDGREKFQKQCIEKNWSKAELELEIKRRFGNRRFGGRRRLVVPDRGHLLVQLEEVTDTWRRWFAAVTKIPKRAKKTILDRHLPDLADVVKSADQTMGGLQEALAEKVNAYRIRVRG